MEPTSGKPTKAGVRAQTHQAMYSNGISNGENGKTEFLKNVVQLLLEEGVEKTADVESKVVEFVHPKELNTRMDFSIAEHGVSDDVLLGLCKDTIKYSVRTGHRRFFNQLFGGQSQYGLAGTWLTDTLNTSQYTFEVAPVFTLMEQEILAHMAKIVGYETWDGIFCPGGSSSNMYGMNLARFARFPQVKSEGMHALPKLCVFTSKQGHYSTNKSAAFLGIGLNSIISIACDSIGRMDPTGLENAVTKAKQQGYTPFYVNATAGTTVAGAYDPLDAIADICCRHNMWLHVDACWGGGALMSAKHRHLLKGIERSASVSWNPHKMMGAPLQCAVFLLKQRDLLKKCHSANAQYLFQQDKFYDVSYDTGDKSVQCGRKVDVFKLWLMWKAKGDRGFEQDINTVFENARYLRALVEETEGFRHVFPVSQCTNVCFWYIPACLRGREETDEWWGKLDKVAPAIKSGMVHAGTLLVGYQPMEEKVNFFRMVVANAETTLCDMEFVVQEIQRLGEQLELTDLE